MGKHFHCLTGRFGMQEQNLSGAGSQAGFHMPSSADLLVTEFYGWLLGSAGGGPCWPPRTPPLPPPETNREALLSREHQHVANCPSCQTMLAVNGHMQLASKVSTWVLSLQHACRPWLPPSDVSLALSSPDLLLLSSCST